VRRPARGADQARLRALTAAAGAGCIAAPARRASDDDDMTPGTGLRAAATTTFVAAALAFGTPQAAVPRRDDPLPRSSLRVQDAGGEWREWWSSDRAPARWTSAPLADAVAWEPAGAPGLEWATIRIAGSGEAWRLRVVLVRLDPTRFRFDLPRRAARDGRAAWTIDSTSAEAALSLNTGQFKRGVPWGWIVRDGREVQPPGRGPLAAALVVDTSGRASIVRPAGIAALRAQGGAAVRDAFQSYPVALVGDGEVVASLRAAGRGVDVAHRDARLAVGELADGRLLVALTRFDAVGEALQSLPFGLTTPETAALMGALGARRALLLDGGTSAQLTLRDAAGVRRSWKGLRAVPLGLEAIPR